MSTVPVTPERRAGMAGTAGHAGMTVLDKMVEKVKPAGMMV